MKRLASIMCIILVIAFIMVIPVSAQEINPYASAFFGSYNTYLWEVSSTSFQVWFSITAKAGMTELGVSYIDIEESSDGVNWEPVKTYTKESYSNLIGYNTANHTSYVTYSDRHSGCQYRAYVNLYAKNSSGSRATYGVYAYF